MLHTFSKTGIFPIWLTIIIYQHQCNPSKLLSSVNHAISIFFVIKSKKLCTVISFEEQPGEETSRTGKLTGRENKLVVARGEEKVIGKCGVDA